MQSGSLAALLAPHGTASDWLSSASDAPAALERLGALLDAGGSDAEALRDRKEALFEALLESAEAAVAHGSASEAAAVGRCFRLYGRRFSAFPVVWRFLLSDTAALPAPRLCARVRVIGEIIDVSGGAEALEGHAADVLSTMLRVLESERWAEVLPEIVPVFSAIAAEAPAAFSASFQDSVELLLGWAVDMTLPEKHRSAISVAFASFREQWRATQHRDFATSLQQKLLGDIAKIAVAEFEKEEDAGQLHTLLRCFYSISCAMGNLREIHGGAVPALLGCLRFYTRHLVQEPSVGVRGIRVCVHALCALLLAAGTSVDLDVVREVLQSKTFHRLRVLLDSGVQRLVLKTYIVLLLHCGPGAQALVLETLAAEVESFELRASPSLRDVAAEGAAAASSEAESLAAFDLAVLRHLPTSDALLRSALRQLPPDAPGRGQLLAWLWEGAAAGGAPAQDSDLDDLAPEFRATLLRASASQRALLQALRSSGEAFWRLLGPAAQRELLPCVWRAKGACGELVLEVALALCPLSCEGPDGAAAITFAESIQPHLAALLDVTGPSNAALAATRCVNARARLLYLCGLAARQPQTAATLERSTPPTAAQLRDLLPSAAPLTTGALVAFLSMLRTLEGGASLSALFWASTGAPEETPPACRVLWLLLQAAESFVSQRLKSPFGSASSTLQFLETLVVDASAKVGANVQSFLQASATGDHQWLDQAAGRLARRQLLENGYQPLACVQLMHMLEQLILLAQEPVHIQLTRPPAQLHSKAACQFFDANRRVCGDWLQRMRGVLRQTLARFGSHTSHYNTALARVADLLRQLVPASGGSPLSLIMLAALVPQGRRKRGGEAEGSQAAGALLSGAAWTREAEEVDASAPAGSARSLEGLEHSLAPLLSAALALRSVGLCRGVFALYGHAAYAMGGNALNLCQDALLAFAAQRHEEAVALFSLPAAGSRAMQALIARTWLDAAMHSRDAAEVERWLRAYDGSQRVSAGMRAFARSYLCLLRGDVEGCGEAVTATKEAAVGDWASSEANTERGASQMQESVCGLSRWADLGNIFMVEASMESRSSASGAAERALQAVGDARLCLQADMGARTYLEPCLVLVGPDACEPNAAPLEVLADVEESLRGRLCDAAASSRRSRTRGLADLQCAAMFDFPVLQGEADRLRLAQHCASTRNLKLASSLIGIETPPLGASVQEVHAALLQSRLLEGQQKAAEAFQLIHRRLSCMLERATPSARLAEGLFDSAEDREKLALLMGRCTKLLGSSGAEIASLWAGGDGGTFRDALAELCARLAALGGAAVQSGKAPFAKEHLQRWHTAVLGAAVPDLAPGLPSVLLPRGGSARSCVNPQFLGWLALQGCLSCPSSGKLWASYGDWLFGQRATLDKAQLEQIVVRIVEPHVSGSTPGGEDFRVLCRGVREGVRRWLHRGVHDPRGSGGALGGRGLNAEWLAEKTKLRSSALWQALGPAERQHLAGELSELCGWLADWQALASAECVAAYVRSLGLSACPAMNPRVQRTLLRVLRLAARQQCAAATLRRLLLPEDAEASGEPGAPAPPTAVWEPLLPQLLAYAQHPSRPVASLALDLFASVARSAPEVAIFPALAAEAPGGTGAGSPSSGAGPDRCSALRIVQELHPELARRAELFAVALNSMATPLDEICARLLQFAETFLMSKSGVEATDAITLVLDRFLALLKVLDAAVGEERCGVPPLPSEADDAGLSRPSSSASVLAGTTAQEPGTDLLRLMGVVPCLNTAYARQFLSAFLPVLRRALFLHRPYVASFLTDAGAAELQRSLLSHLRLLLRTCAHFSRVPSVALQDLAPGLVDMFAAGGSRDGGAPGAEVVLPIRASAGGGELLRVRRVSSRVHMLSTKTKPKKFDFEAADGTCHVFLLKGRDDLRLDSRIMQLLQAVNSVISNDESSSLAPARGAPAPSGFSESPKSTPPPPFPLSGGMTPTLLWDLVTLSGELPLRRFPNIASVCVGAVGVVVFFGSAVFISLEGGPSRTSYIPEKAVFGDSSSLARSTLAIQVSYVQRHIRSLPGTFHVFLLPCSRLLRFAPQLRCRDYDVVPIAPRAGCAALSSFSPGASHVRIVLASRAIRAMPSTLRRAFVSMCDTSSVENYSLQAVSMTLSY